LRKSSREFCLNAYFHITLRVLLHAVNLRHGTAGFTSPPKEVMLGIFSPLKIRKLRLRFEPANLGTRGQQASSRPPKPLTIGVLSMYRQSITHVVFTFPSLYNCLQFEVKLQAIHWCLCKHECIQKENKLRNFTNTLLVLFLEKRNGDIIGQTKVFLGFPVSISEC
jgi:hypothetical protein